MPTLLSETLRQVIAEHNIVISHLAQEIEIDRTTLQHIISGRRLPKKAQMEKLLFVIPIPDTQKIILRQAYEATVQGSDKFKQQEKVKAIIEKIAFVSMLKPVDAAPLISEPVLSTGESEDLYGELAINNALQSLIGGEDKSISFFMPSNFSFFYDTLFSKYVTSPELFVTCFFPISNEPNRKLSDLEYFEAFIPFCTSAKQSFQAYYMRGQSALHDNAIVPFPYFVYTSKYILLLSADMNHAVLTSQKAFLQMYHKKCQSLLSMSSPLLSSPSVSELLLLFPYVNSPKDITSSIENQPCFQSYLTKQLISKYTMINSKENAAIIEIYTKYIDGIQKEPNFFSAFGREGLMFFVETGILAVWPPTLGKPFELPDRIKILERMLHDIKNDKFHCRMIDASKLTIPLISTVIGVRRNTFIIYCLDYANGNVKNICLTEKNIVEAFADFFKNLPSSHLVHSKEETVKAFEDALEKLRAMMPK